MTTVVVGGRIVVRTTEDVVLETGVETYVDLVVGVLTVDVTTVVATDGVVTNELLVAIDYDKKKVVERTK